MSKIIANRDYVIVACDFTAFLYQSLYPLPTPYLPLVFLTLPCA